MPTQELVASDPVTVGPYRLRHRLGSGGMGVVYLADSPGGDEVALKCLPHGVGGEVRDRLRREATFLAAVRHPRVAAFVAADTDAVRPWIAMQYIAGPSLAQASVPLGPAQLRHLCEGVAEALAALHRQRLTHRDVKPGNIILTHDGPVLVDLGIAAGGDLTALTAVGMVVGTPEWMAPEQLGGHPGGHAIDLWGWACVATYAATGRTPFGSGAIDALAHRIRYEAPDLRGVPDWLRGAVTACLTKDARARPTAAQLAAVDGIRKVGRTVAPTVAPPAVAAPPPVRSAARPPVRSVPPRPAAVPPPVRPAAPVVRAAAGSAPAPGPVRRPAPAPTRRELKKAHLAEERARQQARRDAERRAAAAARRRPPAPAPAPAPVPVPPPASTRRSPARRIGSRIVRRLALLLVLITLAVAVGVLAYAWVVEAVRGTAWTTTLHHLVRDVTRHLRGR